MNTHITDTHKAVKKTRFLSNYYHQKVFSWWFPIALMLILFFGGPILSSAGLIPPKVGFQIFLSATIFGVISSATGVRYVLILNRRIGFSSLYCGLLQLGFVFSFALTVWKQPLIKDVSTNMLAPPTLSFAQESMKNTDLTFPSKNIPTSQKSYPGIKPVQFEAPAWRIYETLISKFQKNSRINIVRVKQKPYRIEAYEVSPVFGFIDDFVIVIEQNGKNSQVNMRSRSRVGLLGGDFGVNALRIQRTLSGIDLR